MLTVAPSSAGIRPGTLGRRQWLILLAIAAAAGCAVSASPIAALGLVVTALLSYAVLVHPPLAANLVLGLTPFIVGIDRGAVVPLLRPSEVLLLLLLGPVVGRHLWSHLVLGVPLLEFNRIDLIIVTMAALSSIVPLLWLIGRGQPASSDDLLYSIALWKFYGLYLLVRLSVSSVHQVRQCLGIMLSAAAVVALIAVLQTLGLFGIPQLLASHWAPQDVTSALDAGRGTSTVASSIGVGDMMAFSVAIAFAWAVREPRLRPLLGIASSLFVLGAFASGQFSGVLALVIAVVAVGWLTGTLALVVRYAVPTMAVAMAVVWPVVSRRLSGFQSGSVPVSWSGRWTNLTTFFWPTLFHHFNFLLGVRPSARIVDPNDIYGFVWIESGYTWLLWNGGIPLLLAFGVFARFAAREARRIAGLADTPLAVTGLACFAVVVVVVIMMVFDPHLTLRGSADMTFALLGLMSCAGAISASEAR